MRTILYIIQKEFKQIFRDTFMRTAIIMIPIVQMIVLVYAATFELKEVKLHVVNQDGALASLELENKLNASSFFRLTKANNLNDAYEEVLRRGAADIVMIIPPDFSDELIREQQTEVQLLVDAVDGMASQLALAYTKSVIASYSRDQLSGSLAISESALKTIQVIPQYWYNTNLDYKIFMAPGILVILVTAIGWFMTGMNLVKEKETGTIEQLNVTPIKKYQFLAGKLVPFLIIGLVDLAFGLVIAKILFDIPFEGSFFTLFIFSFIYLFVVLGVGLLISTISNTQQQVLFVSFFFMMTFVLMSGLFTAVENMPQWGQMINKLNPLAYFSRVIRMVLLKGSSLSDISSEIYSLLLYAIVVNSLAVWRYKKVS